MNSPAPKLDSASFRDPSGFVFTREGVIYRQINQVYKENYASLMESGLYQSLVEDGSMLPHSEVDTPPAQPDSAYKVIQPERLPFISYPYEWSFSQLKDAALTTLKVQKRAMEYGMVLKDSSAYNIQFHKGLPTLIDTLSFERYREGDAWVPYRQFCQHFLAPLSLMAHRDTRLNQLLSANIDGIPLDLASALLPGRTRLSGGLMLHIHLHAASQKKYAAARIDTTRQVSHAAVQGLIDSLESAVRSLQWKHKDTNWESYYTTEHNYTPQALEHKQQLVSQYLEQLRPGVLWDLGANTGLFSRIASAGGSYTLSFDYDPGAVELNYLQVKKNKEGNLLPLLQDLFNPSPAIGWENKERFSLIERANAGVILALALIHHLAIGNNVPLDRIARFFRQLGRWLVVEFVPKDDAQVQRLLGSRQDIFQGYTPEAFEEVFRKYYTIHRVDPIQDTMRCLYLMEIR